MAFSLTFEKNFIIVYPEKYSTRIQSILELLDLENRVVNDKNYLSVRNSLLEEVDKFLAARGI